MTTVAELARQLPKVELHCHLEGAIRPATVADLARVNGVALPVDDLAELFHFEDLTGFLEIFSLICASLRTPDDFRRITYEALEDAAAAGVRYREMFFSPGFLAPYGVPVGTAWAGIRAGLADAHTDLDIRCRMILDIDKGAPPGAAVELVEFAAAQDRDELIGIGGDNTERGINHRTFADAFALAARRGLRRTMHCGEDGPAANVTTALDVLGCQRIDHGVRAIDDPALLARLAEARIPLTVCPISNVVISRLAPDVAAHPFGALRAAGVFVTINSDDPGMTETTINDDYAAVADAYGYDFATMASLATDAIAASWAPADEQAALHARFAVEIAPLAELAGVAP